MDQPLLNSFNPVFKVSEFNELINNHLSLLGDVTVEGELSRWDIKNNRLIFGAIKDAGSTVDVFTLPYLVKNYRDFEPGMVVRVTGSAGIYKQSSKFRLYITSMVPQGEGALQLAFEKLKARLEAEGLFAPERKRPLPQWPVRIGLITAKDSSAYFDLIKIITARMCGLEIKLIPVNVQGREAISTILRAYSYINSHSSKFDVIIMARGGGSLEDLQAFNSEELARAVYSCKVPVISAIGHEDNWSLTDYVADIRASTPSNAAELVVQDRKAVIFEINSQIQYMRQQLAQQLELRKSLVNNSLHRIHRSTSVISSRIDNLVTILNRSVKNHHLTIKEKQLNITRLTQLSTQSLNHQLILTNSKVDNLSRLVKSLDYRETLKRGFTITRTKEGKIINSLNNVKQGDHISTQLTSGSIDSIVS